MNNNIKQLQKRKIDKRERVKLQEMGIKKKTKHVKRRSEVIVLASPRLFKWSDQ